MASLQRVLITYGGTKAGFQSNCDLRPGQLPAANNFLNWLAGTIGGTIPGSTMQFAVGAIAAVGSITQTSTGAANGETLTVCGVTFTARTSGASGNEWNRSDTVATSAANLAAAINASASTNIYVVAVAVLGVVTITMLQPGVLGNVPTITEACSNTTCVTFAGGSEGTVTTVDLD